MARPVRKRMFLLGIRFHVLLAAASVALCTRPIVAADTGTIQLNVSDVQGEPLPCRIHLRDPSGKPLQAIGQPFWKDHFVCSGRVAVAVTPGRHAWEIERGPEYQRASGAVEVSANQTVNVNVTLAPIASLRDEGWFSGDLHVHRPISEIEPLMLAEDLDFAPVIGWWNTPAPNATTAEQTEFRFADDRIYCSGAGEDERAGGALLYFGLKTPLDLTVLNREVPSPMHFVREARRQNKEVWIDVEKPFWWDVPTWVAMAKPDSIGIAHNHMHRGGVLGNEAWGRARDIEQFPGIKGNGLWTQQIYYHLLNAGIRIPPSAGSASGVLPNPVGYNRVYVHLGDQTFHRDHWFAGLKAGRCFVTNGPLLRVKANGSLPGTELQLDDSLNVELEIELTSNDLISEIEVVHNGVVTNRIACSDATDQTLRATMNISDPGWFLVRAIADVDHTFRFASTAPWYVADGKDGGTIRRTSVGFFLDWLDQRIEQVHTSVPDPAQREAVLREHIQAREFWLERFEAANQAAMRSGDLSWQFTRDRLVNVVRRFGGDAQLAIVLRNMKAAASRAELIEALEPLVLLEASVNPESRVKLNTRINNIRLDEGRPQRFLIKVENMAGITAPLNLSAVDLALNPPGQAEWCEIEVVDGPFTSRFFTGETSEYKVVQITSTVAGPREVRLVGDAGQGTQDLGFRATADLLLEVQSKSLSKVE